MKKILFPLAIIAFLASCGSEEATPVPDAKPQVNALATESQAANDAALGLNSLLQSVFSQITQPAFLGGRMADAECVDAALGDGGVTVSFSSGCTLPTGQAVSGSFTVSIALTIALSNGETIEVDYVPTDLATIRGAIQDEAVTVIDNGLPTQVGVESIQADFSATLSGLSIDGNALSGSASGSTTLQQGDPQTIALSIQNASVTQAGESAATTISGQYTAQYTVADSTTAEDDEIALTGTFSGTTKEGYAFSGSISEELVMLASCSAKAPVTGKVAISVDVRQHEDIQAALSALNISSSSSLSISLDLASDAGGNLSGACDAYAAVSSLLGDTVVEIGQ
jgi:hypothetical protein